MRSSRSMVSPSAAPLEHSRPKLAGWSGSPCSVAPPTSSGVTRKPQPTPQYGQVVETVVGGAAEASGTWRPPLRRQARVRVGAPEDQRVADRAERRAGGDQVGVPGAVFDRADQNRTGEHDGVAVAAQEQPAIGAARRVAEHHRVRVALADVAGAE